MQAIIESGRVLQPNLSLKEESLVIDGEVIVDRGPQASMRKKYKRYKRVDAEGHLVLPGFINAHTHAALSLARGKGEGMPLFDMFQKILFPLERKIKENDAYLAALVSGMEFIKTGTTAVNNVNAGWSRAVVKAFKKLGLRATLALALKDRDIKTNEKFECKHFDENVRLVKSLANENRLHGMFGLANEVEASEQLITRVKEAANELGTGIHMHVAESIGEKGYILQKTGKTSVKYLYDLGVLNHKSLAVHAVNITKKDITILAKSRVTVVHCPTVNLNLGSGVSPVREMLNAGVSVAIGVDDPVANVSNDLRHELMNASVLQKSIGQSLSFKQLLSMAWNSRLYGYSIGSLREGAYADIIFVDTRKRVVPQNSDSLLRGSLFAFSPVTASIIGGEFVMRNSKLLGVDEARVIKAAQRACNRLVK